MKKKGSMTIEASFLIPMLISVIIMLLYLMFYSYNSITSWKNTYYVGLKEAEEERGGASYPEQQQWQELSRDTLVLPEDGTVTVKKNMDSVVVTGQTDFTIPFYDKVTIQQKSTVPVCGLRNKVARLIKWSWM